MKKEIIFIGLGRMGAAMTEKLVESEYIVHGFDTSADARTQANKKGITTYETIPSTIEAMEGRKVIWVMVPAKFVDSVLSEVYGSTDSGDIIIDGGNTFFKDTLRRAEDAAGREVSYIDCGTSGGVDGARHGASMMIGAPENIFLEVEELFKTLASKDGYARVGDTGAGHFVKMVHNGIEYGMMGAIAEGLAYIEKEGESLNVDTRAIMRPYTNGSIISSNLMKWIADAYTTEGYLENIAGEVPHGETEGEMEYIIKQNQTPVLKAAVEQRKSTRERPSRIGTLIAAMRNQFGGHSTIEKDRE